MLGSPCCPEAVSAYWIWKEGLGPSLYTEREPGGSVRLLQVLFAQAAAERRPLPGLHSALCVSFSIQSEVSFEGAYGNLKRLCDKAAKTYHRLQESETRKLSPSKKR